MPNVEKLSAAQLGIRPPGMDELRQVWREAMEDKGPGVPVKEVLNRLERKYRALAKSGK
ncbi:MAG: hypothetical protein WBQ72_14160 [Terriglobales bacterium]|jgi:antitoxin ParD1/3/4